MDAFITGSHAYGTPGEDSDLDLVISCDYETALKLEALNYGVPLEKVSKAPDLSLKFGRLNLIVCISDSPVRKGFRSSYEIWSEGTEELIKRKPVTRDQAVELFAKLRSENSDATT